MYYTREISRLGNGKLCPGVFFVETIIIQCNWGFDIAHSKAMMMGYKSFIIEVGLYGNTMDYNYKRHSMLATNNTWLKNVWELVSYYNVSLNFDGIIS